MRVLARSARDRDEAIAGEVCETVLGAHPQPPVDILVLGPHDRSGQPVAFGVDAPCPVLRPPGESVVRRHPHAAVRGGQDATGDFVG